jgi:5-(hydroxymethyl)furfural/furfural oxidase
MPHHFPGASIHMMFDVLILGGGSAGCVLAARLSENGRRKVLLVEAGADLVESAIPPDIETRYPGRAFLNAAYLWPALTARFGDATGNDESARPQRPYEQARILGGGSSINALAANRGGPTDYDEWESLGAAGWSWTSVLPYFKKLERDCDFADSYHGNEGPVPIRRFAPETWSPYVRAVAERLQADGYAIKPDQNGPWEDGIYPMALSLSDRRRRLPTALAYLTPETRRRSNLEIRTLTRAERLVFEDGRAVGAEVIGPGGRATLRARETIVACGAIHSPALLLRSGIGDANHLGSLEIPTVRALPGVGRNLMEHPSLSLSCYLDRKARWNVPHGHHIHALLRFSSGLAGCPSGDMQMSIISRSAWHALGQRIGSLFFWVNKPYSRGAVQLRSPDPAAEPLVDFRLLSDWRDLDRLKAAFRYAAGVMTDAHLDGVRSSVFPAQFSARVRKLSALGPRNAAQLALAAAVLDVLPRSARERILREFVTSGVALEELLADDTLLAGYAQRAAGGVWHASGTCRMGPASDPLAVTDSSGRVRGLDGLRVCDASLMPSIPCANTNIPTIMLAEKISDTF